MGLQVNAMYQIYELVFDQLVPNQLIRVIETAWSVRLLRAIMIGTLVGHTVRLFWHAVHLVDRLAVHTPRQQPCIAFFWQIAVVALLAAQLNVRLLMGH
jgi:hypothetical protein